MNKTDIQNIILEFVSSEDFKTKITPIIIDVFEEQVGNLVTFKTYIEKEVYGN